MTDNTPRSIYRLANFTKALERLEDAVLILDTRPLTDLEKEGLVQRFEYTWELAWKTLADYLNESGVIFEKTPKAVIRAAFAAGLIEDGDIWMEALKARNLMSHAYDPKRFEKILIAIKGSYLQPLKSAHATLTHKTAER